MTRTTIARQIWMWRRIARQYEADTGKRSMYARGAIAALRDLVRELAS